MMVVRIIILLYSVTILRDNLINGLAIPKFESFNIPIPSKNGLHVLYESPDTTSTPSIQKTKFTNPAISNPKAIQNTSITPISKMYTNRNTNSTTTSTRKAQTYIPPIIDILPPIESIPNSTTVDSPPPTRPYHPTRTFKGLTYVPISKPKTTTEFIPYSTYTWNGTFDYFFTHSIYPTGNYVNHEYETYKTTTPWETTEKSLYEYLPPKREFKF